MELEELRLKIEEQARQLRASEERAARLESMLNSLPDWIYEADERGKITYCSDGIIILGYTPEEVLGRSPFDFIILPEETGRMRTFYQDAVDKKKPLRDVENKTRKKDGSIAFLELSGEPFFYQDGSLRGYKGVIRDITKRKKAESDLRDSEERFRLLHQATFAGIGIHDRGLILEANDGLSEVTGFSLKEIIGMDGLSLIAPEWREFVMEKILSGYGETYEVDGLKKDGSRYRLEIRGKEIPYHGRKVRVTEFRDITSRKAYENEIKEKNDELLSVNEELQAALEELENLNEELMSTQQYLVESEIKYRNIINGANEIISVISNGKIKFVNVAVERVLGFSIEEMMDRTLAQIIHPQDAEMVMNYHKARMKGEEVPDQYDTRMLHKNGSEVWTRINASVFNWEGERASLIFVSDITDRKKIETRLEQTRAMLQAVLMQSPIGIGIVSMPDMNITLVNDRLLELHGAARREGVLFFDELRKMKTWQEYDANNSRIDINDLPLLRAMRGLSTTNREIINQDGEGNRRTVLSSGTPVFDKDGNHIAALVVEMEITDRKTIEEQLRNQNSELAAANEELVAVNEEFEAMNEELVQSQVQLEITQQKYKKLNEELEQRVKERTEELSLSMEKLRNAQDHLVEAEKMASLGELVAGIAHEINTPIGVGVTAASFLRDRAIELGRSYNKGTLVKADFESFISAAEESTSALLINLERAADLIQSFKQVSVDQSNEKIRIFNLKGYVDEVLLSLHSRYKRTGHSIQVLCPEEINMTSYPGIFFQIISNLVMNSLIHAFEDIDSGLINMNFSRDGDSLVFFYSDNGKGMNDYNRKRIFNPFHTTKRGKGGTGLGMHIVFNHVTQKLGGTISCSSAEGKGTSFTIKVPISIDDKNA